MKVYTEEDIVEISTTWSNFNGFSGETCYDCKGKANVFALEHGWFCDCGAYNVQSFTNVNMPHEIPDMGTPLSVLVSAHQSMAT